MYEKTVRPLMPAEREQDRQENLISAELILLPREHVPPTFEDMVEYIDGVVKGNELLLTDVALEVYDLMRGGPGPYHTKPVWQFVAFAARGTLPPELQALFNIRWDKKRDRVLDANFNLLRRTHRFIPDRFRTVRPAVWAERRMAGEDVDMIGKARQARRNL